MSALVLTRPIPTGLPGTTITNINIYSGDTIIIDSVPYGYCASVKWIYTLRDEVNQYVTSAEVFAHNKFGIDIIWNWTNIIGDFAEMKHNINVAISGSPPTSLDLQIISLDVHHDWIANAVRIQVLS